MVWSIDFSLVYLDLGLDQQVPEHPARFVSMFRAIV